MCGIFALFGPNLPSQEIINEYFKLGSKRGPESSKLISFNCNNNTIYLGFHRLAINGLNSESDQPIYYKDYVLICNGEIFNYKELIQKYNLEVTTQSDCEVIVHLYDLIGMDLINELDGEFAFIIYNKNDNSFVTYRDPYGVRPLYVNSFNNNETIMFCSDVAPLNLMNDLTELKQVVPGTFIEYQHINNIYIEMKYKMFKMFSVDYSSTPKYNNSNKEEYISSQLAVNKQHIYEVLKKAIYKRVLTTERPLACLLSGGLDSSIVASFASRFYKELTGKQIETYSIGLADSEDLKFSQLVAEHIGSKHTQIVCSEDDFFNAIPNVVKDIESYDTTTIRASVGNWLIGKYIRENSEAKVVLNGDGADEVMGGYLYLHACPDEIEFDYECKRLLNYIHHFDVLRSDKSISSHGLEPRTPYLDTEFVRSYFECPSIIRDHKIYNKPEKYLMREIIAQYEPDLLPLCVLERQKEAFSDGVSGLQRSWYEIIQSKLETMEPTNELMEGFDNIVDYEYNIPTTKEQKYYRFLFEKNYKGAEHIIPFFWMPKYVNATDASARTLTELYTTTTTTTN
jgi:asparagine synthase (glutamine-hydrolysing)